MLKAWMGMSYMTVESRTHNDANELVERGDFIAYLGTLDSTYDKAGNLRTQEVLVGMNAVTITYTYDAWNRLVKIKYSTSERAEYRYNGLNWRIEKFADTSTPPNGALNQRREMYYSANWQLVEERIDRDALAQNPEITRHMQYIWGPRYIDDIVARVRTDLTTQDTDVWYHLTDSLFSTVAIIDDTANLIERVSYDAYGRARHHRAADLNGNGAVTTTGTHNDQWLLQNSNWHDYGVGDLNRDGVVDNDDLALLQATAALSAGQLSSTDNIINW